MISRAHAQPILVPIYFHRWDNRKDLEEKYFKQKVIKNIIKRDFATPHEKEINQDSR